jgi:hypothetical protein
MNMVIVEEIFVCVLYNRFHFSKERIFVHNPNLLVKKPNSIWNSFQNKELKIKKDIQVSTHLS